MRPRGLIFISNVQKALEHEWFADAAVGSSIEFEFVLFNAPGSELFNYLKKKGFACHNYPLASKYLVPFYIVFFSIRLLFRRYDFVHCHLLEASLIGILSAKLAGVKKRIYTRHHSDFHHTYFPHAVRYDKLVNHYATHIVAVSQGVKEILVKKEDVDPAKVSVIPHGIPLQVMDQEIGKKDIDLMKEKYGLQTHRPLIGVVSRFTIWKGVQYIIPAFKAFLKDYPEAKLVLANAKGEYEAEIRQLLADIPADSYLLINFESQMPALFSAFDIFVHVPVDATCEAFGQVYIEALNLEVPMVCTLSGIANDLIRPGENALVVNYKDAEAIHKAMQQLMRDPALREKLIRQGKRDVKELTFEIKHSKLRSLYLD